MSNYGSFKLIWAEILLWLPWISQARFLGPLFVILTLLAFTSWERPSRPKKNKNRWKNLSETCHIWGPEENSFWTQYTKTSHTYFLILILHWLLYLIFYALSYYNVRVKRKTYVLFGTSVRIKAWGKRGTYQGSSQHAIVGSFQR